MGFIQCIDKVKEITNNLIHNTSKDKVKSYKIVVNTTQFNILLCIIKSFYGTLELYLVTSCTLQPTNCHVI